MAVPEGLRIRKRGVEPGLVVLDPRPGADPRPANGERPGRFHPDAGHSLQLPRARARPDLDGRRDRVPGQVDLPRQRDHTALALGRQRHPDREGHDGASLDGAGVVRARSTRDVGRERRAPEVRGSPGRIREDASHFEDRREQLKLLRGVGRRGQAEPDVSRDSGLGRHVVDVDRDAHRSAEHGHVQQPHRRVQALRAGALVVRRAGELGRIRHDDLTGDVDLCIASSAHEGRGRDIADDRSRRGHEALAVAGGDGDVDERGCLVVTALGDADHEGGRGAQGLKLAGDQQGRHVGRPRRVRGDECDEARARDEGQAD